MFIDNAVVKRFEGEYRYDRFAIAGALFDVSFKGAFCSVIESQVMKNCDACNLKYLCGKIGEIVQDYAEKTTAVTNSFSFSR